MALHIDDPEVEALVAQLMQITGMTDPAEVVHAALERAIKNHTLQTNIAAAQGRATAIGPVDPNFDMKAFSDGLWCE